MKKIIIPIIIFCALAFNIFALPQTILNLNNELNITDETGNYTYKRFGSVYTADGFINGGEDFDGIDDYFNISSNALLKGWHNFTIAFMMFAESGQEGTNHDGVIMGDRSSASETFGIYYYDSQSIASNKNKMVFNIWTVTGAFDSGQCNEAIYNNTIPEDEWNFITVVYDNNYLKLYRNASLICEASAPQGNVQTGKGSLFHFGQAGVYDLTRNFKGQLDDIYIYNDVFTQEMIIELYENLTVDLLEYPFISEPPLYDDFNISIDDIEINDINFVNNSNLSISDTIKFEYALTGDNLTGTNALLQDYNGTILFNFSDQIITVITLDYFYYNNSYLWNITTTDDDNLTLFYYYNFSIWEYITPTTPTGNLSTGFDIRPESYTNLFNIDLNETAGVLFLLGLLMFYIALWVIGFVFDSAIFTSFAVTIGFIISLVLFQFSFIFAFVFFMFNVGASIIVAWQVKN